MNPKLPIEEHPCPNCYRVRCEKITYEDGTVIEWEEENKMDEKDIDQFLANFDYVRVIGRGENNHIGIELTVKCLNKRVDDSNGREMLKDFLLTVPNRSE